MADRPVPLAIIDIRFAFSVATFGESGEWVEGTATINPGPGGMVHPDNVMRGDAVNLATVKHLFEDRQHNTRMMRIPLATPPDSDFQRGADLQSMQAGLAALVKSIDLSRR